MLFRLLPQHSSIAETNEVQLLLRKTFDAKRDSLLLITVLDWIGFSPPPPSFHLSVQNAQMETFKFLVQFPQNDDATRTDTYYYYGRGEQYVFQKNTITDVLSLSLSFFSSSPPYSIHLLGIIQLNSIFNRSNKVCFFEGGWRDEQEPPPT